MRTGKRARREICRRTAARCWPLLRMNGQEPARTGDGPGKNTTRSILDMSPSRIISLAVWKRNASLLIIRPRPAGHDQVEMYVWRMGRAETDWRRGRKSKHARRWERRQRRRARE